MSAEKKFVLILIAIIIGFIIYGSNREVSPQEQHYYDSLALASEIKQFKEDSIEAARDSIKLIEKEAKELRAWMALTPEERALEKIKDQFSSWDGSHTMLKQATRKRMKNPDSFEHVETKYYLLDTTSYRVIMEYRGTNSFNATVTNAIQVDFSVENHSLISAKELY